MKIAYTYILGGAVEVCNFAYVDAVHAMIVRCSLLLDHDDAVSTTIDPFETTFRIGKIFLATDSSTSIVSSFTLFP